MNRFCSCDLLYDPCGDKQRYCLNCWMWFDKMCMRRFVGSEFVYKDLVVKMAKKVPISGGGRVVEDWMICGMRKMRLLVDEVVQRDDVDGEWGSVLPQGLLEIVGKRGIGRFYCP